MKAKPSKISQILANGERLVEVVAAYRMARGAASAEGAPVTERTYVSPDCNKPKSYKLPPLDRPSEIPGWPLAPSRPGEDIPEYGTIGRVKATRAAQAERRGKKAPLTPSGSSELRKRHYVRAWKVAE